MDRDNARDTRAPSNRDVRLRRRTGLGGALVTGRALRRRSLNALFTRARHVHRPRQSSFASSSRPTHHPSPPLARIRGASRDRAIDRVVPTPRRRHPARVHEDTPEDVKKKFHVPLSIGPRRHPSRASSLDRDRRASKPPPRDRPRARISFIPTHSRAVAPVPAFERTRFGPAPLFTMVNAPRETRDEADVALVVIFVPTTAEVMVSPCIVVSRSASACAVGSGVPGPGDARGHPRVVTRRCVRDVMACVRA